MKKNFRLDKDSFYELLKIIGPNLRSPNRRALPADKKLGIALYFLKDTGTLNMTANTFGIQINTTSAVSEFEAKFGMIQAYSCIYGTHIPLIAPRENSHDFYCYKQFYSLNVQGVCD